MAARAPDRLVTGRGPFDVLECPDCRLGLTRPQLDDAELAPYYSSAYYEGYCDWRRQRDRSPLRRARARWRSYATTRPARRHPFDALPVAAPGRVLDVGCGDGALLQGFADRGWEAVGLDPSATAIEAVRGRGFEAHEGTLGDHPWPAASFDAVLFHHALEHIPQPVDALGAAASLLVGGGVVAVVVPNWTSWQRGLFGSRWSHLDLPRHQQHFSTTALGRAARRVGLHPLDWGTQSNVISPAYSLHYCLSGRWTEDWTLWAAYAMGTAVFPVFAAIDRARGGDCCYLVAERPRNGRPGTAPGGTSPP